MDCSCSTNGTQTTCVSTNPTTKLKKQTVLPKVSESRVHAGDASIVSFVKHKRRNAYTLRSVESVKANAYADWVRNQIR